MRRKKNIVPINQNNPANLRHIFNMGKYFQEFFIKKSQFFSRVPQTGHFAHADARVYLIKTPDHFRNCLGVQMCAENRQKQTEYNVQKRCKNRTKYSAKNAIKHDARKCVKNGQKLGIFEVDG